jgi:DNA-binding CsgD family transcriptional regulator
VCSAKFRLPIHSNRTGIMYQFENEDVERIVALLGRVADPQRNRNLPDTKHQLVTGLMEIIDADIYVWSSSIINPDLVGDNMTQQIQDGGWRDDREKALFYQLLLDPRWHADVFHVMCDLVRHVEYKTLYSEDYLTQARPAACAEFEPAWAAGGFGHLLMSTYSLNDNIASVISFTRRANKPRYTERERMLVHLLFSQVDWLHRSGLNLPSGKTVLKLTPRERQVLIHLMGGDALKQIATKMGLSRNTIDTYVKSIYRQLNVSSRPELMAQFTAGAVVA